MYRVEVLVQGSWTGNQLTFDTEEQARLYALDLASRWTLVDGWRVVS